MKRRFEQSYIETYKQKFEEFLNTYRKQKTTNQLKRKFKEIVDINLDPVLSIEYYIHTVIFSGEYHYNEMTTMNLRPKKRKIDEDTPLETNSDWEEFYEDQLNDETILPQKKGSIFEKVCMRKF